MANVFNHKLAAIAMVILTAVGLAFSGMTEAVTLPEPLPSHLFPAGITDKPAPKTVVSSPLQQRHVVINIPSRSLTLYEADGSVIRKYPVGIGRVGFSTPIGQHQVIRKMKNPGWENPYKPKGKVRMNPGRSNPLGTRWIGFKADKRGEYGIHGTNRPSSVGKYSSHGCVRMFVKDAEDLFERVDYGTMVTVTYELVEFWQEGDRLIVKAYPDRFKKGMPSVAQIKQRILKAYPEASINQQALKAVLKSPTEKPVIVGNIQSGLMQVSSK